MHNFNIDSQDFALIESLLRNNTNIERIYNKLYKLELEDKKNTEEYKKLLDYLSVVIEVEDKIYKEANLTPEKTLSWLKFLSEAKNINNTILIRINTTLFNNLVKKYNNLINLPDKEIPNILTMAGIKQTYKKETKDKTCKCIIIKETIQKDIIYVFLSFLQQVINDPNQHIFREQLTKTKYDSIFLNKDIESFAIKNNLNLPDKPYIISPLIQKLLKIEPTIYNKIKDLLSSKIVSNEIYELLEINDSEYSDINKSSNAVTKKCMIEAAFIFMSDHQINDINYTFHEYIEDKEYTIIHPNNYVSENLIINSFKNINKNKRKIRSLSLK